MPTLSDPSKASGQASAASAEAAAMARAREAMVISQIVARGVADPGTLAALREIPRHSFVPVLLVGQAYADRPLPIGYGQTISQPYIVAFMAEALGLTGRETVLEVGAGCGYQTAVLSRLAARVFALEIIEPLAVEARERLASLGYNNVEVRAGDGAAGWPEQAPFDAILVAAAAPRIPPALKEQLKDGGRLILPVGEFFQELRMITRRGDVVEERDLLSVQFVPMTGEIRED